MPTISSHPRPWFCGRRLRAIVVVDDYRIALLTADTVSTLRVLKNARPHGGPIILVSVLLLVHLPLIKSAGHALNNNKCKGCLCDKGN